MTDEAHHQLSLSDSAAEWALSYPEAAAYFDRLGLDYGCGGKSLETLCLAAGLEPRTIFEELQRLIDRA